MLSMRYIEGQNKAYLRDSVVAIQLTKQTQ